MRGSRPLLLGTQRDCRKHNSNARREIEGVLFESRPRKGFRGQWVLVHGKGVSIRQKTQAHHGKDPWRLFINGQHVGTDMHNLQEMIRSNMWAIRKGLHQ